MTKDRAEMWAEALSKGDAAMRVAEREQNAEYATEFAHIAQGHYLRAIAIQLDGIRRALVELAHDRKVSP